MTTDITEYQRNIRILASSYDIDKKIDVNSDEFMYCIFEKLKSSQYSFNNLPILLGMLKAYTECYSTEEKAKTAIALCEQMKIDARDFLSNEIMKEIRECYEIEILGFMTGIDKALAALAAQGGLNLGFPRSRSHES